MSAPLSAMRTSDYLMPGSNVTDFVRPTVSEIHKVLARHNALIVHFSGGPPMHSTDGPKHSYPDDLRHVLEGKCQGGVCCSTVMPGDTIGEPQNNNAVGCIGLLRPREGSSLMDVDKSDCGSSSVDGVRTFQNQNREIDVQILENSISCREPGTHNEWASAILMLLAFCSETI